MPDLSGNDSNASGVETDGANSIDSQAPADVGASGGTPQASIPQDYGNTSSETPETATAPRFDLEASSIATTARHRFETELTPELPTVNAAIRLESGAPSLAAESLDEQMRFVLPYLSRYFAGSDDVVLVGLMSADGGANIVRSEFGHSPWFAEAIIEYIHSEGFGAYPDECSGVGGFAHTDSKNAIVLIDVGASCDWSSDTFIDDSEAIVGHELMHIAQFGLAGTCAEVPAWFVEGQAEFVGWNLAFADGESLYADTREFVLAPEKLAQYGGTDGLDALADYTDEGLEYYIGAMAVELLVAHYGWEPTLEVLRGLNQDTSECGSSDPTYRKFSESFFATFGMTIEDFSQHVGAYVSWASGG